MLFYHITQENDRVKEPLSNASFRSVRHILGKTSIPGIRGIHKYAGHCSYNFPVLEIVEPDTFDCHYGQHM